MMIKWKLNLKVIQMKKIWKQIQMKILNKKIKIHRNKNLVSMMKRVKF